MRGAAKAKVKAAGSFSAKLKRQSSQSFANVSGALRRASKQLKSRARRATTNVKSRTSLDDDSSDDEDRIECGHCVHCLRNQEDIAQFGVSSRRRCTRQDEVRYATDNILLLLRGPTSSYVFTLPKECPDGKHEVDVVPPPMPYVHKTYAPQLLNYSLGLRVTTLGASRAEAVTTLNAAISEREEEERARQESGAKLTDLVISSGVHGVKQMVTREVFEQAFHKKVSAAKAVIAKNDEELEVITAFVLDSCAVGPQKIVRGAFKWRHEIARRQKERQDALELRSAIQMQRIIRGRPPRIELRQMIVDRDNAQILDFTKEIQRVWRGAVARANCRRIRFGNARKLIYAATSLIQRNFRVYVEECVRHEQARLWHMRRKHRLEMAASVVINGIMRQHLAKRLATLVKVRRGLHPRLRKHCTDFATARGGPDLSLVKLLAAVDADYRDYERSRKGEQNQATTFLTEVSGRRERHRALLKEGWRQFKSDAKSQTAAEKDAARRKMHLTKSFSFGGGSSGSGGNDLSGGIGRSSGGGGGRRSRRPGADGLDMAYRTQGTLMKRIERTRTKKGPEARFYDPHVMEREAAQDKGVGGEATAGGNGFPSMCIFDDVPGLNAPVNRLLLHAVLRAERPRGMGFPEWLASPPSLLKVQELEGANATANALADVLHENGFGRVRSLIEMRGAHVANARPMVPGPPLLNPEIGRPLHSVIRQLLTELSCLGMRTLSVDMVAALRGATGMGRARADLFGSDVVGFTEYDPESTELKAVARGKSRVKMRSASKSKRGRREGEEEKGDDSVSLPAVPSHYAEQADGLLRRMKNHIGDDLPSIHREGSALHLLAEIAICTDEVRVESLAHFLHRLVHATNEASAGADAAAAASLSGKILRERIHHAREELSKAMHKLRVEGTTTAAQLLMCATDQLVWCGVPEAVATMLPDVVDQLIAKRPMLFGASATAGGKKNRVRRERLTSQKASIRTEMRLERHTQMTMSGTLPVAGKMEPNSSLLRKINTRATEIDPKYQWPSQHKEEMSTLKRKVYSPAPRRANQAALRASGRGRGSGGGSRGSSGSGSPRAGASRGRHSLSRSSAASRRGRGTSRSPSPQHEHAGGKKKVSVSTSLPDVDKLLGSFMPKDATWARS